MQAPTPLESSKQFPPFAEKDRWIPPLRGEVGEETGEVARDAGMGPASGAGDRTVTSLSRDVGSPALTKRGRGRETPPVLERKG